MSMRHLFWCGALTAALAFGYGSARAERKAPQDSPSAPMALFIKGTVVGADGVAAAWIEGHQVADGPGPYPMQMFADPTTCRVWQPFGAPPGLTPWATWRLDVRPVKTADEQAVVDVTWSRAMGQEAPETEQALRLVLTPGAPTPIDLLPVPSGAATRCSRFIVELGTQIGSNSGRAVLHYDMWLVQRDAEGRERAQRQQTNGVHAGETPFIFAPRYYGPDGVAADIAQPGGISTAITGKVRGRVRSDGSIVITLDTMRSGAIVEGHGSVGWSGLKEIVVKPGETIEVAIPPPGERRPDMDPDGRLRAAEIAEVLKRESAAIRITTTQLL